MDGYDKVKPYGFAIHAAICGYSRRVLWLRVSNTNNDPGVIASYFMTYVKEIKGVPCCVRSDAGTENILVEDIQKAFRWQHTDDMAAEKSLTGSSKSNRILLQNLNCVLNGIYSVRAHRHLQCKGPPSGGNSERETRQMFFLRVIDAVDFKVAVAMNDVDKITEFCKEPMLFGCSEDCCFGFSANAAIGFRDAFIVSRRNGVVWKATFDSALENQVKKKATTKPC